MITAEQFSNALGKINDKYIIEAITYERGSRRRLLKWSAAVASIGLILVGAWMLSLGQPGGIIITAYAFDSSGTLSSYVMKQNVNVPLSKIEVEPGMDGFLFSYPKDDENELSGLIFLSGRYFPEKPRQQLRKYMREKGIQYFFFIPTENENMPVEFDIYDNYQDGKQLKYEIEINSDQEGYTAILKGFTIRPSKSGVNN